jgi:hypothetical protein
MAVSAAWGQLVSASSGLSVEAAAMLPCLEGMTAGAIGLFLCSRFDGVGSVAVGAAGRQTPVGGSKRTVPRAGQLLRRGIVAHSAIDEVDLLIVHLDPFEIAMAGDTVEVRVDRSGEGLGVDVDRDLLSVAGTGHIRLAVAEKALLVVLCGRWSGAEGNCQYDSRSKVDPSPELGGKSEHGLILGGVRRLVSSNLVARGRAAPRPRGWGPQPTP